ncbi:Metallo-dependent phosphatase [Dacryopinax primogenitus]|uniref:Purple acid phosphatase n=1 Tax=Dacryopinax primogenitus (strain DJM 731) TaxID=1858805 RepID=M5G7A8_DACPD|nr:Metallo-dependent phosphatase [Dacryopinax primogenitus]EJU04080.1 Metallo-dependent phosphatase [Dacryopinax primogenitus]
MARFSLFSLLVSVLAASGVLAVANTNESFSFAHPLEHRIAYAGARGMFVSWNTFAQLDTPTVWYGCDPFDVTSKATGNSTIYPTSRTWNHHVKLTDLKPNTKYWYYVSNTNCYGCSELPMYTFTTAREAGDETPYSAAVAVDLGLMGKDGLSNHVGFGGAANPLGPNDTNTIQSLLMYKDTYDFLAHFGDIAYADYALKESWQGYFGNDSLIPNKTSIATLYESLLEQYYDEMQPISAVKPYMVGPGNHEANCDNGGTTDTVHNISYTVSICVPGQTNFTGYINHFRMPSEESSGNGNFWYSFDHGMVHWVAIDTETDIGQNLTSPDEPGGSENENSGPFGTYNQQLNWLDQDLASVDRSKTPWIVVGAHRPWYVSAKNRSSTICLDCRHTFEPILIKHNVDLVMHGHVHVYERNQPMKNYNPDPNGLNNPSSPWYIVNGAAGHYDGLDSLNAQLNNYSVVATDKVYGWSRLTFHNRTHMTHQFVASKNGTVLDTATLYKEHC